MVACGRFQRRMQDLDPVEMALGLDLGVKWGACCPEFLKSGVRVLFRNQEALRIIMDLGNPIECCLDFLPSSNRSVYICLVNNTCVSRLRPKSVLQCDMLKCYRQSISLQTVFDSCLSKPIIEPAPMRKLVWGTLCAWSTLQLNDDLQIALAHIFSC